MPTLFGYAAIISDVCVTFSHPKRPSVQRDMLQKVYPVGNFIVAGFAGSVEIGFQLLDDLSRFLSLPEGEKDAAWYPEWVAEEWHPRAQRIFASGGPEQRRCGSQLVISGVSPDEDVGIPGLARSLVVRMSAPRYEPEISRDTGPPLEIGCGAEATLAKERMVGLKEFGNPMMQGEVGSAGGGYARVVMMSLAQDLTRRPIPGVSHHLQLVIVTRGRFLLQPSDHTTYVDGVAVPMCVPPLARSWDEFVQMATGIGASPSSATC
jgi:hypothetical protein